MLNSHPLPYSPPRPRRFGVPFLRTCARVTVFSAMAITLTISVMVAAVTLIPGLFGMKTMVVTSGSMVPYLDPGDVALVKSAPAEDVRMGDAISFYRPDGRGLVTHRVVDIKAIDGVLYFQTKGDANAAPDANLTPANAVFGVVKGQIPRVGFLLQRVTTDRLLRLLTISIPVMIIAFREVRGLMRVPEPAPKPTGDIRDESPVQA